MRIAAAAAAEAAATGGGGGTSNSKGGFTKGAGGSLSDNELDRTDPPPKHKRERVSQVRHRQKYFILSEFIRFSTAFLFYTISNFLVFAVLFLFSCAHFS